MESTSGKQGGVKRRGFASLAKERMREIASQGGKTAHAVGRAHRFTPDTGRAAAALGGRHDVEHMRRIGRKGGLRRATNEAASKQAMGLTAAEVSRFVAAAMALAGTGNELALAILMQAYLGLRLLDIRFLRVFDLGDGTLDLRRSKGDAAPLRLTVPPDLAPLLAAQAKGKLRTDLLFSGSLDAWQVSRCLRRLCAQAQVPAVTLYSVRKLDLSSGSSVARADGLIPNVRSQVQILPRRLTWQTLTESCFVEDLLVRVAFDGWAQTPWIWRVEDGRGTELAAGRAVDQTQARRIGLTAAHRCLADRRTQAVAV